MKLRIVEYRFADHQGVLSNTIRVLVWDILSVLLFTHQMKFDQKEGCSRQASLYFNPRQESDAK